MRKIFILGRKQSRGDTIVEVLLAVAIAGFAIGTSYALSNSSLQRAITSRERNEALDVVEGQIAALKKRQHDPNTDFSVYEVPSTGTPQPASGTVVSYHHFCLNEQSTGPSDTTNDWGRIDNFGSNANSDAGNANAENLTTSGATAYNPGNPGNPTSGCVRNGIGGTPYYIDISALLTHESWLLNPNKTSYRVVVRWPGNEGPNNSSVVYYRF